MGSRKIDRVVHEANQADETGLRAIRALPNLKEIAGTIKTPEPNVVWIKPTDLYVDETYQRNLSRKSLALIAKIVTGFSWSHYKPPVVAKDSRSKVLFVIDGQHTAIAAASHPDLKKIPVLMVEAKELASRARGFIAHNRDRIAITGPQMHYSSIVAGDPEAIEIGNVCDKSGVAIVRFPPPGGFGPGETMALTSIKVLLRTIGAAKAIRVLKVLADASCAPVRSDQIKAVARLLYSSEFEGEVSTSELKEMLSSVSHDQLAIKTLGRGVALSNAPAKSAGLPRTATFTRPRCSAHFCTFTWIRPPNRPPRIRIARLVILGLRRLPECGRLWRWSTTRPSRSGGIQNHAA